MDMGTTASISATSSTALPARLPSSAQQPAVRPPAMGIRLPQAGVLSPTPSGGAFVVEAGPQFVAADAGDALCFRLGAAVRRGDATVVKRMLAAGEGNLNTIDPDTGLTVLALAAMHGHADVVFLLCKDASASDIHFSDLGDSALTLAARNGHIDVVELLLGKSATQEHKDRALHYAAMEVRTAIIELLITHGARIDQPNAMGNTPLHDAAMFDHGSAVLALLKAGACVDCADADGNTPLMIAARIGATDTVKLLAKTSDVNLANRKGDTALILAARGGYFEIVQRLLVKGAQAGKRNALGKSALSAAREAGHGNVAQFLSLLPGSATAGTMPASSIALDSIVARASAVGSTSTTTAGKTTASTSTSSTSMSGSAAPRTVSSGNIVARPAPWTLLQAVERNDAKALLRRLKVLRNSGKNLALATSEVGELDSRNDAWLRGKLLTPLMAAAYLGHELLLRHLLANGADVDQVDSFGRTALLYAARSGQAEVVQALEEAGAEFDHYQADGATALLVATEHGQTTTVQALLDCGAQVDPTSFGGFTPLMSASRSGDTATVKALLKARADVHKKLADGRTALTFAKLHGHTRTVQMLLEAGAGEGLRMMQD